MTQERVLIKKIEFYITNVCNLNCERCNRFNNHNFRGFQKWSDYEEIYSQWAKHVDFDKIVILGGEPLLNPTIMDWARGIHRLWNQPVQILSNGTRINHVKGLYDALVKDGLPIWLGISWHDTSTLHELDQEMAQFLTGPIAKLDKFDPDNTFNADILYYDARGVKIPVWYQDTFGEIALHINQRGRFALRQNDPVKAHENCGFAKHKNYHFIKGNLYKCGPVALFPEFDDQHDLDLDASDKQLLRAYRPLSVDRFDSDGADFLKNIDSVIPQCKFCPIDSDVRKIVAVRKNAVSNH